MSSHRQMASVTARVCDWRVGKREAMLRPTDIWA